MQVVETRNEAAAVPGLATIDLRGLGHQPIRHHAVKSIWGNPDVGRRIHAIRLPLRGRRKTGAFMGRGGGHGEADQFIVARVVIGDRSDDDILNGVQIGLRLDRGGLRFHALFRSPAQIEKRVDFRRPLRLPNRIAPPGLPGHRADRGKRHHGTVLAVGRIPKGFGLAVVI